MSHTPRPGPGIAPARPGPARSFLAGLGVVVILSFSGNLFGRQQPQQPAAPAEQKPAAGPATYAGSETCQPCHEDIFKAFQKNAHATVETDKRRGWETKACESCHGPGSKHAESAAPEDILNPAKQKPADADRSCLKCHLNDHTHVGRVHGSHARNQVSCAACHSIHKGPEKLAPRTQRPVNQQCVTCHVSVWAEFQRPHRHNLPEGSISCTDCHNPHGSFFPNSIRTAAANEPGCFKCHADKRGPFTFEHPPMRLEGCRACHEPHGSANPHLLTRSEVRFVCLECHANIGNPAASQAKVLGSVPPAFHDLRSPRYRNCTICHIKVHGSYVNRSLLR